MPWPKLTLWCGHDFQGSVSVFKDTPLSKLFILFECIAGILVSVILLTLNDHEGPSSQSVKFCNTPFVDFLRICGLFVLNGCVVRYTFANHPSEMVRTIAEGNPFNSVCGSIVGAPGMSCVCLPTHSMIPRSGVG